MRLFLGIALAESVLSELTKITDRLRPAAPNLRWSAPESWHITLQFLGATTPDQYDCLIPRLAELRSPPIPIHLAELGFFDRAGIFYAAAELTSQLVSLQQHIVTVTASCGFEPETRPFHPHITLARSKGRDRDLHGLQSRTRVPTAFTRFTVPEFLLYESHLSQTGTTYQVRHRFSLTGAIGSPWLRGSVPVY